MCRCLAGHADDMDVVLDRLPGGLFGGLEQRADIDIEADIGKRGGDDLGAAVMPVLAKFDDQHARPPAFLTGEGVDLALDAVKVFVVAILAAIDAGDRLGRGMMAGKGAFERMEISPTEA